MKKRILFITLAVFITAALSACSNKEEPAQTTDTDGKIEVVATTFPEYDFLRQIAKEHVNLSMLLPPGAESHSYEPTPQDILKIQNSDIFVYVGGDSDAWVAGILDSMDQSGMNIVTLMDCVDVVEEEIVEGMEEEEEEEEEAEGPELDEHVWTSPRNAILIVQKLRDELCRVDPGNAEDYKTNAEDYIGKLNELDKKFQDVVDHSARKEIILGDRFPFRYFVDAYGLSYYAAFPGCSTDTEASAATVAFLIDKVKEDDIPVVFHIELSNEQMCDTICDATGAKKELLNAVHNVSRDDFNAGVTYLELMEHNVEVLKEALN
jgi:zinc transport system substrate-binding protein